MHAHAHAHGHAPIAMPSHSLCWYNYIALKNGHIIYNQETTNISIAHTPPPPLSFPTPHLLVQEDIQRLATVCGED